MANAGDTAGLVRGVRRFRNHMTADDLRAFIVEVRTEADAMLARLATVDAAALPADLHKRWEQSRRGWEDLRGLTADDVVALHEAACLQAGRELTTDELRGLLGVQ